MRQILAATLVTAFCASTAASAEDKASITVDTTPTAVTAPAETGLPGSTSKARTDYLGPVGPWESWLVTTRTPQGLSADPMIVIGPGVVIHGHMFIGKVDVTKAQMERLAKRLQTPAGDSRPPPLAVALPDQSGAAKTDADSTIETRSTMNGASLTDQILRNTANITINSGAKHLLVVCDPFSPATAQGWNALRPLISSGRASVTVIPITRNSARAASLFVSPNAAAAFENALAGRNIPIPADADTTAITAAINANERLLSEAKIGRDDLPVILTFDNDGTMIRTPLNSAPNIIDALAPESTESADTASAAPGLLPPPVQH